MVVNNQDEVLLVKTHRGGWVFPGGQIEVGENVMDGGQPMRVTTVLKRYLLK
ncbi:NUDIX domain-containing protein [Paenibacillus physcomitrellae]|nr:NUDIX domain-containing protein [Paenibacillus physcomitrellae]